MDELIYQRPADYELEHEGNADDVEFFVALARRLKPKRVLEVACGSGRVTQPLANLAAQDAWKQAYHNLNSAGRFVVANLS